MQVEEVDHRRRDGRRVSSPRAWCAPSATPTRRRSTASGSMPATASSATCGAARSTCQPATSCRWRRRARRCPTAGHRAEADPRHPIDGHAVLGPRARPRRRPHRHPHPARGHAARRAVRRGAGHRDRDRVRRRPHPQPARLLGSPRRRPRPRRAPRHRRCRLHRRVAAVADGAGASAPVELVDGERCPRFTTHRVCRASRSGRRRTGWRAGCTRPGCAPINNVVDVSNYVMLELNQPNHAYDLDTLGGGGFRIRLARDGEPMITLDGVERTMTADDLLICDANDTPIGIGGVMGGLDSEITDATTTSRSRSRGSSRPRSPQTDEPPRSASRGVGPVRAWRRPVRHAERAQARFVELLRETCPDLVVHDGAVDARHESLPPGCARPTCASPRSTAPRHVARRRDDRRADHGRSASRSRRRTATRSTVAAAVVAARQHRRDRRDRGGRAPLRLRQHRQDRAEVDHARPAQLRCKHAAGTSARCCSALGLNEAMHRTRSWPTTISCAPASSVRRDRASPTRSSPTRSCCAVDAAGPAAGHRASTSRTAARVSPVRDRSRVPARRSTSELPARVRGAGCRPRRSRRDGGDGRVARDRRGDGLRRARVDQAKRPAGCTRRARRRCRSAATRSARWARSTPMCSTRSASTSASPCSSSTSPVLLAIEPKIASGSRPAASRPPTSTSPSSCPTRCPPRRSTRRSSRRPVRCSSTSRLFDVYRGAGVAAGQPQPGLPPAAAGARPHAHRHRADRPATKVVAGVGKLGATLR